MNTIGSHPGAILFRLALMIILIGILIAVFLSYVDKTEREFERASIRQTKKIIDSSLAIVFSRYAINGRLNELNELDGANPFDFLQDFGIAPPGYRGVIQSEVGKDLEPGWYYLARPRLVVYKSYFIGSDSYFAVRLDYRDVNQSGRFEQGIDRFKNLYFLEVVAVEQ